MLQGIALLAKGAYHVQPANYWINTGASTWAWILLIAGLVVGAAGFGVLSGAGRHSKPPRSPAAPAHSAPSSRPTTPPGSANVQVTSSAPGRIRPAPRL